MSDFANNEFDDNDIPDYSSIKKRVEEGKYDFKKSASATSRFLYLEDVYAAILATYGNISVIADMFNKQRHKVDNFIKRDPHLFILQKDLSEGTKDKAEENIFLEIRKGNVNISRWFLETQGKDRNYTRRIEQTGKDGGPVEVSECADKLKDLLKTLDKERDAERDA